MKRCCPANAFSLIAIEQQPICDDALVTPAVGEKRRRVYVAELVSQGGQERR